MVTASLNGVSVENHAGGHPDQSTYEQPPVPPLLTPVVSLTYCYYNRFLPGSPIDRTMGGGEKRHTVWAERREEVVSARAGDRGEPTQQVH